MRYFQCMPVPVGVAISFPFGFASIPFAQSLRHLFSLSRSFSHFTVLSRYPFRSVPYLTLYSYPVRSGTYLTLYRYPSPFPFTSLPKIFPTFTLSRSIRIFYLSHVLALDLDNLLGTQVPPRLSLHFFAIPFAQVLRRHQSALSRYSARSGTSPPLHHSGWRLRTFPSSHYPFCSGLPKQQLLPLPTLSPLSLPLRLRRPVKFQNMRG